MRAYVFEGSVKEVEQAMQSIGAAHAVERVDVDEEPSEVHHRLKRPKAKFKHYGRWTEKDERFLIKNYEKLGALRCAKEMGRSIPSLYTRVKRLRAEGVMD